MDEAVDLDYVEDQLVPTLRRIGSVSLASK